MTLHCRTVRSSTFVLFGLCAVFKDSSSCWDKKGHCFTVGIVFMRLRGEVDHSPPTGVEVKNEWSDLHPMYAFVACTGMLPFYSQLISVLRRLLDYACPFAWPSALTTVKWDRMMIQTSDLVTQGCDIRATRKERGYFVRIQYCGQTCWAAGFLSTCWLYGDGGWKSPYKTFEISVNKGIALGELASGRYLFWQSRWCNTRYFHKCCICLSCLYL